jgi:hypothetical protein
MSLIRRAAAVSLVALALVACGARKKSRGGLAEQLAALDAAWRPERVGFEGIVRARIEPLLASHPDEPEVLWRHARLLVAEGLALEEPESARDRFAMARSEASRCLDLDVAFRRRRQAVGWASALELVPPARQRCVDQLAWSWTRWWAASDPIAMAIDETPLRALARRAAGDEAPWTRALFEACRPAAGPDERAGLASLMERYGEDLAAAADVAVWGGLSSDARDELITVIEARLRPGAKRDTAALARAREGGGGR